MGTKIPIADLAGLLSRIPDQPMGSPGLGPELGREELDRSFAIDGQRPGTTGAPTARAAAGVSIFAFNSEDDADADGVLGVSGGEEGAEPTLAYRPDRAWIKTRVEVSAGAAGGADLPGGGLDAQAGGRLLLADYRVFGRAESARAAVASSLARARFALLPDDVLELAPGDALSLQLSASLSASLTVRWADVFASRISLLRAFVGEGEVVPLKLAATAQLSATVKLKDELLLGFTCVEAGSRYRVSLRKARARALDAEAGLGVEVELEDPGQVESAVSEVVEALLGGAEDRVRAVLARAVDGLGLGAEESSLVESLCRRFGVPEPAAVLGKLDELKRELDSAVQRLARNELEVGFRYQYQRIEQDSSLFAAVMDGAALRRHHGSLVRTRLEPLLEEIRRGEPGISLEEFLGQREVDVSRGWGFSLAFGKWSASGSDLERVRSVEQRDAAGHRRASYLGLRSYRGSWGGTSFEWAGDFGVSMDAFSEGAVPRVQEYDFGVHLLWRSSVDILSERSLREHLDTALVWEVFPQYALSRVTDGLRDFLGSPVEIVTQLRLGDGAFRALLAARGLADPLAIAGSLGAAMPWLAGEPGRDDVVSRRSLYGPLWAEYLRKPDVRTGELARAAENYLARVMHQRGLARRERGYAASRPFTFAGLVELNPGTRQAWEGFREGMLLLRDSLASGKADDGVVPELFGSFSGLWKQSLHLRASGALLLDLARATGSLDTAERSLSVASPEHTVVIGA